MIRDDVGMIIKAMSEARINVDDVSKESASEEVSEKIIDWIKYGEDDSDKNIDLHHKMNAYRATAYLLFVEARQKKYRLAVNDEIVILDLKNRGCNFHSSDVHELLETYRNFRRRICEAPHIKQEKQKALL